MGVALVVVVVVVLVVLVLVVLVLVVLVSFVLMVGVVDDPPEDLDPPPDVVVVPTEDCPAGAATVTATDFAIDPACAVMVVLPAPTA